MALSQGVRQDPALEPLLAALEMRDPRQVRVMSVLSLFEQEQERLPPFLMADTVLAYDDLPWAATFSMQAQLKRMADLAAVVLLLITSPLIVVAAVLIWLDDRGPIFYSAAQRLAGKAIQRLQVAHHVGPTGRCPGRVDSGGRSAHHGHWWHSASSSDAG